MWPFIRKIAKFVIPAIASIGVTILISFFTKKRYYNIPDEDKDYSSCSLAKSGEIPYHVSIQLDFKHLCSGSLIHEKYVLTIASCVDKFVDEFEVKSRMKVFVGINARTVPNFGFFVGLDRIKTHPTYIRSRNKDNVAVIRLMQKIDESQGVKIIALPTKGTIFEKGLELLVSGYGQRKFLLPEMPSELHRLNMEVIDDNSCRNEFDHYDTNRKFCAVPSPQYPPCKGDRGSPATVDRKYIIGIYLEHSLRDCNIKNPYPELFLLLSPYLDFIQSAMA